MTNNTWTKGFAAGKLAASDDYDTRTAISDGQAVFMLFNRAGWSNDTYRNTLARVIRKHCIAMDKSDANDVRLERALASVATALEAWEKESA